MSGVCSNPQHPAQSKAQKGFCVWNLNSPFYKQNFGEHLTILWLSNACTLFYEHLLIFKKYPYGSLINGAQWHPTMKKCREREGARIDKHLSGGTMMSSHKNNLTTTSSGLGPPSPITMKEEQFLMANVCDPCMFAVWHLCDKQRPCHHVESVPFRICGRL